MKSDLLASTLKSVIAPVGQTFPQRLQVSRQYPDLKLIAGVIHERGLLKSEEGIIIFVGHDLIQLPQRLQRML